jgi:hypothetical protein
MDQRHQPLGITYHPNKNANVIADCLEIQFTSHDLCYENHERRVETTAQVLPASVDDTLVGKVRPCDILKLANSLKLRKACGLDGIPNECQRHFPIISMVNMTNFQSLQSTVTFSKVMEGSKRYNVAETR